MMTPETLTRHELNGLHVEVVAAANPDLVGIAGRVVVETMGTLHVDDGTRVRQVQKRGATFEFALPPAGDDAQPATTGPGAGRDGATPSDTATDEAAGRRKATGGASKRESETAAVRRRVSGSTHVGSSRRDDCEGATYVTVDGNTLLSRPARRTETTGDSKWR
jgi:ribonuclease P protein subunit POP4